MVEKVKCVAVPKRMKCVRSVPEMSEVQSEAQSGPYGSGWYHWSCAGIMEENVKKVKWFGSRCIESGSCPVGLEELNSGW